MEGVSVFFVHRGTRGLRLTAVVPAGHDADSNMTTEPTGSWPARTKVARARTSAARTAVMAVVVAVVEVAAAAVEAADDDDEVARARGGISLSVE